MDIELIKKFVKFCKKKLKIKDLPKVQLTQSRKKIKTTAGYVRGKEIIIYTKGRHMVDVCRSIAHELKHHKQWEDKEFGTHEEIQDVGGKFEDEANAIAGTLIKQFAYDGNMGLYENKILVEGRLEDAKKRYPVIPEDIIIKLSENDPSGNNKYLDWMIKQYRSLAFHDPIISDEVIEKIVRIVTEFNDLLPYFTPKNIETWLGVHFGNPETIPNGWDEVINSPKDINNYDTVNELRTVISGITKIKDKSKEVKDLTNDVDVLLDDEEWKILRIKNYKSSCKYGAKTKWCISGRDSEVTFNNYISDHYLFFIINKDTFETDMDGEKVAVLVPHQSALEPYNFEYFLSDDSRVDYDVFSEVWEEKINIIAHWMENHSKLKTTEIKLSDPSLYNLSQFLDDDNLRHYKFVQEFGFKQYQYTKGKSPVDYFIGDYNEVKDSVMKHYRNYLSLDRKRILNYPEYIKQSIMLGPGTRFQDSFIHQIFVDLGFHSIHGLGDEQNEIIKRYYHIPPSKLKGTIGDVNSDKLDRIREIQFNQENIADTLKSFNEATAILKRQIKIQQNHIIEVTKIIDTLNIRRKQVVDDTAMFMKIDRSIERHTRDKTRTEKYVADTTAQYHSYNKQIKTSHETLENLHNELKTIIDEIESTRDNTANYEYSKQQIIDAKKFIERDIIDNPLKWVKKAGWDNKKLFDYCNIARISEFLSNDFMEDVTDFGDYKLVGKSKEYYIYELLIN